MGILQFKSSPRIPSDIPRWCEDVEKIAARWNTSLACTPSVFPWSTYVHSIRCNLKDIKSCACCYNHEETLHDFNLDAVVRAVVQQLLPRQLHRNRNGKRTAFLELETSGVLEQEDYFVSLQWEHPMHGSYLMIMYLEPDDTKKLITLCCSATDLPATFVGPSGMDLFYCERCGFSVCELTSYWQPYSSMILELVTKGESALSRVVSTQCPDCASRPETHDPTHDVIICDPDNINALILQHQLETVPARPSLRFGSPSSVLNWLRNGDSCRMIMLGHAIHGDIGSFVCHVHRIAPEVAICVLGPKCGILRDLCELAGARVYIERPATDQHVHDVVSQVLGFKGKHKISSLDLL